MANQSPSGGKVTKSMRQVKPRVLVQLQVRMRRCSWSIMRASCNRPQTNYCIGENVSYLIFQTWAPNRACRTVLPGQGEVCRSGVEATGEGRALREQPTHLTDRAVLALADSSMSAIIPWSTLTHSGCHAAEGAFLHLGRQQRTRDGGYCGGASFTTRGSGNGCGRRQR